MTPANALRRRIEGCELQHPAFKQLYRRLGRRIDDALQGFAPCVEGIVGPSRVGKSMLIGALARQHPETKVDGKRCVPVLVIRISPNISPTLLPTSVLEALGVPLPLRKDTTGVMLKRMVDQLRLAQNKVLIFEEASHLVEPGARVPPRAAGDWFKSVIDDNFTIMLFGVPRLERLFESNEQLRLRSAARQEFRPYDMRNPSEQMAFASCVRTYADLFVDSGWPLELPFAALVTQCYLLSGGLIGLVSRFMQELASQMAYEAPRPLTLEDCQSAARAIESAGHPDFPAFERLEAAPVELHAAHAHVLETNGMAVRRVVAPKGGL